jgi:hypothetical protein
MHKATWIVIAVISHFSDRVAVKATFGKALIAKIVDKWFDGGIKHISNSSDNIS